LLQKAPPEKRQCNDAPLLLLLGYVHRHHGIDVALSAARLLQSEPKIQFWFFGPMNCWPLLREDGLPNTKLVGYVPSRFALIDAVDQVDICLGI